jgi:hypothetical protein
MLTRVGCVATVLALAGCATPGYNPSRLEGQLERAGATPAQARCVVDGLTKKYAESQLGSHSEPSAGELAFTRGVLKACKVTLPLQPLP